MLALTRGARVHRAGVAVVAVFRLVPAACLRIAAVNGARIVVVARHADAGATHESRDAVAVDVARKDQRATAAVRLTGRRGSARVAVVARRADVHSMLAVAEKVARVVGALLAVVAVLGLVHTAGSRVARIAGARVAVVAHAVAEDAGTVIWTVRACLARGQPYRREQIAGAHPKDARVGRTGVAVRAVLSAEAERLRARCHAGHERHRAEQSCSCSQKRTRTRSTRSLRLPNPSASSSAERSLLHHHKRPPRQRSAPAHWFWRAGSHVELHYPLGATFDVAMLQTAEQMIWLSIVGSDSGRHGTAVNPNQRPEVRNRTLPSPSPFQAGRRRRCRS